MLVMDLSKEPNLNLLGSKDFIPEKYVRELSQNCVGGPELRRLRSRIHGLSDETNNRLKKNVYENYAQFIDTAKELSNLENEMHMLSTLLSEQRSLLTVLSSSAIVEKPLHNINESEQTISSRTNDADEENRRKLTNITEKVENCPELKGHVMLEGDLIEVDVLEGHILNTIHAYLFTDGLMTCIRNQGGLMKYIFEQWYELGSLAVVNVRDMGSNKHQFKLLIFPETRVFQCTSNSNKKEWLDKFDLAKKTRLSVEQRQLDKRADDQSPTNAPPNKQHAILPDIQRQESESTNEEIATHPDWFVEIPEELDVCIAQRHFEECLVYLQKARDYITTQNKSDHILTDIQRKIDQRQNHVTEVLIKELEVTPDKSFQGGLRAARRAVKLLNQLGSSTQSCQLFLKLCSSMLKSQCKRVKREGSTTMYVRHLSGVVFTNLCHMTEEFLRAFPLAESKLCYSSFIVWTSGELSQFTNHFIKQVFIPQTQLSTITDCVVLVREQCERLCTFGVDLCYQLDGTLRGPLIKALRDARDKAIDAIKLRANESVSKDIWLPMNLRSKASLARYVQECKDKYDINLDKYYSSGQTWLQLSENTLAFSKSYITLLELCLRLLTPEIVDSIDGVLFDILDKQLRYNEESFRNETQPTQRQFITKNSTFLLITLQDLVQTKYRQVVGCECSKLNQCRQKYSTLMESVPTMTRTIKAPS